MTPERRQLRRLRWRGTVLFAITTAMCLVVLAVMASVIDSRSHTRETYRELGGLAAQLARSAASSGPDIRFDSESVANWTFIDDTFAFVDPDGIVVASPSQRALPSSATISDLMSRARNTDGPVRARAPAVAGPQPVDWVVLAVPYSDTVVFAGASAVPPPDHRKLDLLLVLSVLGLCAIGTALGHLLSGLAMRPAIRSIEQHEQFLREAAHELRTPLAVMRLALDEGGPPPHLATISTQVTRMSALVAHLLDRARIRGADPASFELEPVRLDQVIEVAVEELEDVEGGADVRLDLEASVVTGNADLLAQAVRNLVENALRHGAVPVVVTLRGRVLSVTDRGPGVPVGRRRSVLEGGRTTAAGSGTGTGLAIVAWVAGVHGAGLALGDAGPHGLRVTITFPDTVTR
jgi:two-component system OmpR family sensor kinase